MVVVKVITFTLTNNDTLVLIGIWKLIVIPNITQSFDRRDKGSKKNVELCCEDYRKRFIMLPIFTHTTKGKESDESQFFSLWEHDKFTDAHTLQ